ncbi:MAG: hypothetical protein MUO50_00335 [Longimicrobiales bacterium]|nr:hypothetical protein [Longimicrobiales bacterium]
MFSIASEEHNSPGAATYLPDQVITARELALETLQPLVHQHSPEKADEFAEPIRPEILTGLLN